MDMLVFCRFGLPDNYQELFVAKFLIFILTKLSYLITIFLTTVEDYIYFTGILILQFFKNLIIEKIFQSKGKLYNLANYLLSYL